VEFSVKSGCAASSGQVAVTGDAEAGEQDAVADVADGACAQ
jgi:hypothetical protein